jgi:hypothetical protein
MNTSESSTCSQFFPFITRKISVDVGHIDSVHHNFQFLSSTMTVTTIPGTSAATTDPPHVLIVVAALIKRLLFLPGSDSANRLETVWERVIQAALKLLKCLSLTIPIVV